MREKETKRGLVVGRGRWSHGDWVGQGSVGMGLISVLGMGVDSYQDDEG